MKTPDECGTSSDDSVPVMIDGQVSWLTPESAKLACAIYDALPIPPFETIDDQLNAMEGGGQ